MRFITYKGQTRVFRALIDIIKVLAKIEGENLEADDAIGEIYMIAHTVGGKEMSRLLKGGTSHMRMNNATMTRWSRSEMATYIKLLEEIIEEEKKRA